MYRRKFSKWRKRRDILLFISLAIVALTAVFANLSHFELSRPNLYYVEEGIYTAKEKAKDTLSDIKDEVKTYSLPDEKGRQVKVIKVSDGDTFTIEGKQKVRLIGVDTPESVSPDKSRNVPYGKTASAFTKKKLLEKTVVIKTDIQRTDKYGRLLAYVYLEDGTFFNKLLLKKGYARVMTVPPNVMHEEDFVKAAKVAREKKRGVWKDYDAIFPEG